MCTSWVGQTDDGIYDVTVTRHQMLRSYTVPSTSPAWHTSVSQLIKQNKYL